MAPDRRVRVLYDGWPLVHQPNGPAALHLLTILENLPPEVEPHLALPDEPPGWVPDTNQGVRRIVQPTPATERGRLGWEQRRIPALAEEVQARLVHLTGGQPALFGRVPGVFSPTGYVPDPGTRRRPGLAGRLRTALAAGGVSRARGFLWPEDLPLPHIDAPAHRLPVAVNRVFTVEGQSTHSTRPGGGNGTAREEKNGLEIPETYILYHGPTEETDLRRLLAAWSWAAGPLGEYYPLLVLGLPEAALSRFQGLCRDFQVDRSVRTLPVIAPDEMGELYRGCAAVFHPAPVSPWGGPLRAALASGKPVVAAESALSDAMAGPAAYLAPESESRALGAALITTIVEENVAEQLRTAARERTAGWRSEAFSLALGDVYRSSAAA